jgi:hypothetical protein
MPRTKKHCLKIFQNSENNRYVSFRWIQFPIEVLPHPKSVVTENLPKRVSVEGSKLTTSILGMVGLTVTGSEPVCILKQNRKA